MKVILKEDVQNLGQQGDVVEVKSLDSEIQRFMYFSTASHCTSGSVSMVLVTSSVASTKFGPAADVTLTIRPDASSSGTKASYTL